MKSGAAGYALHPLDILRAGRWTRALFGTYAMSLGFFEAAPLHALRRAGASDIRILADVSGVAGALGEAGAREVGRSYVVEPVLVDDGCFHPKFILLDGDAGPRMVVGSGNLTFGGWGRNLELAEVLSPASAPAAFGDMADFLATLDDTERVTSTSRPTLSSWAASMRSARGEGGPRILHNLRSPIAEQIAAAAEALGGARRLAIASPYFGRARAVSRLAQLLGLDRIQVHVPAKLPLGGEYFDFQNDAEGVSVIIEEFEEAAPRAMHAKMIEVVCADGTLSVSGSTNASGPALASARNVELAVVRVMERRLSLKPTQAPPPAPAVADSDTGASADRVLTAALVGKRLVGHVLDRRSSGTWSARLDATGEFRDLGEVEIATDNRFEVEVAAADEVGFGARRAVLLLQRAGERISGFVTFPDLMELNRRFGPRAGCILRIVNGSDEDEDSAGALEYFASHAEEALAPWRTGATSRADHSCVEDGRMISLDRLSVQPRAEMDTAPSFTNGAGAMERLLAALRRTVSTGRAGRGRSAADDEEDALAGDRRGGRTERTDGIFAQLCEVLETRVPDDPVAELHRLADLGVFVLSRRPDAERVAEFATWWTALAAAHLRCPTDRADLRLTATVFILLDALPRRGAKLARQRLASIIGGDIAAVLGTLGQWPVPHRLERLIDESTAGRDALLGFADDVASETSSLEELAVLIAAIRTGAPPPPLPALDPTPEMARVRSRIATGHADRIQVAARSARSCPKCGVGLPETELERFRSVGLVIPVIAARG